MKATQEQHQSNFVKHSISLSPEGLKQFFMPWRWHLETYIDLILIW